MPTIATYPTPEHQHPRTVCFHTHTDNKKKRFVTYGLVTGSKRVRRELDMPCSAQVFDNTLRAIAKERFDKQPIHAEIGVMADGDDICDDDVCDALSNCDEACVQFWESNMMLFGSHNACALANAPSHTPLSPSTFRASIQNNDVMHEKYYGVRSTSRSGCYEHLFAIACRFQINADSSMFLYASHIHSDKKTVPLSTRTRIWSAVKAQLLASPQQWVGVPTDVHFKHLCKMDGWTF